MSYTFNTFDSSKTFVIIDNEIDTTKLPISLIGKSAPIGWGSYMQQDMIYMLENFASATATALNVSLPPTGQTWFDKTTGKLRVNSGTAQSPVWSFINTITSNDISNALGFTPINSIAIGTPGSYKSVTVDTFGRVTAGTNPTTISGYGITDAYTKAQSDANYTPQYTQAEIAPSVAPPSTGTYPVGTWMRNSTPAIGGIFGWVVTAATNPAQWSQIGGAIGGTIVGSPNPFTIAIISPAANATISGITSISVQCGTGMAAIAVRDNSGNLLVQGTLVNNSATLNFDSSLLSNGTQTIVATAYDAAAGAGGQYGTATHIASAAISVNVSNVVVAPSPSPSSWTPLSIPSLVAWYDPSDSSTVTLNGSNVAALNDKSGNGNHLTQATSASQPALASAALNSRAVLRFPGTGALYLSAPASATLNNIWTGGGMVAIIVKPSGGGTSNFGTFIGKTGWDLQNDQYGSLTFDKLFNGGTDKYWVHDSDSDMGLGIPSFVENVYTSDSYSNQPIITINGKIKTLDSINQPDGGTTADIDTTTPFLIGNYVGHANPYQGDIGEIFVFSSIPSDSDRALLRAREATQWGLTIASSTPSPSPSPSPSPTPTPSGIKTGIFTNGDSTIEASTEAFETFLGHSVAYAVQFGGNASSSDFTGSTGFEFSLSPTSRKLLYSQPLIWNGASLALAAAGSYNSQYASVAANIATAYTAGQVFSVRIGWEFNGDWYPWNIHGVNGGGTPAQYAAAFRLLAVAIRSANSAIKIEWCPNWGQQDPTDSYPGDDVVDFIGMDLYENSQYISGTGASRWSQFLTQPGTLWDLTRHAAFASLHGKPMSIPEYASNINDGFFVTSMANWIKTNNVDHHSYWNSDSAFAGKLSDYPVNQAAYLTAWS